MPSYVKEPGTSDRMEFQIVDRQMIINQLEAIKILESTIRNEVIEAQVWGCLNVSLLARFSFRNSWTG